VNSKEISFLARVRQILPALHPAERRLGDFVCDFPGEVASYSAQELAALAQVSKATVSRFVQRLGYENYEAARKHARLEKQSGSRLFLTTADPSAEQSIAAQIAQGIANLEATFLGIGETQINTAAKAILDARKVWVIGFRASFPLANYLKWQLIQVIENAVALPGSGETFGEHLVSFKPDDVVIFFGLRRRVSQTSELLAQIEKTGAKLMLVTDEGAEIRRSADWHFRCQTLAPGPMFNHVAVMALCHLLITRCIELAGAGGRNRLRSIEALNDVLDEL
jgi:DNA-binding MurR/RpiR family transcriptional regulator